MTSEVSAKGTAAPADSAESGVGAVSPGRTSSIDHPNFISGPLQVFLNDFGAPNGLASQRQHYVMNAWEEYSKTGLVKVLKKLSEDHAPVV